MIANQQPVGRPEDNAAAPKLDGQAELPRTGRRNGSRTDKGRLHVARNSVLSRGLLETLCRHGENRRSLRRMETELRAVLKPCGALGKLLFSRFWCCVLRLILVARIEEKGLAPRSHASKSPAAAPSLREGLMPILLTAEKGEDFYAASNTVDAVEPDLFRRLALIARYDRAASKEMYRTLLLLILMRDDGEAGLAAGIRAAAGIKTSDGREK